MTAPQHPHRPSARIYHFPIGGRAAVGPRRLPAQAKPTDPRSLGLTPTEAGSGWYHDAAIQEAKRSVEH